MNSPTTASTAALAEHAYRIRRNAVLMGEVQGQGYIGQALDIADVLAVAYFGAMQYQPQDPDWEGRDRFMLSNGHYAIALYAALFEAGFLPPEELETYGSDDSRLPISVGRCLGLKRKGSKSFVYTLFSDGELDEGSTWEGIMSAAHWKLDNLIAIVDVNNQQADGPSTRIMSFEPLVDKLQAFGWFTQRVDGNDIAAVSAAFQAARAHPGEQPRMIVCDTRMGCGVPFLEQREKNHFIRVDPHEWQLALEALEAGRQA
jgi:transketolase